MTRNREPSGRGAEPATRTTVATATDSPADDQRFQISNASCTVAMGPSL